MSDQNSILSEWHGVIVGHIAFTEEINYYQPWRLDPLKQDHSYSVNLVAMLWQLSMQKYQQADQHVIRLTADFVASVAILWPTAVSQTLMSWQLISHAFLKSDTPKNFWTIPSVHFKLDSKLNLKKMLGGRVWLLRYGLPTWCITYILWSQTIHRWRNSQHI